MTSVKNFFNAAAAGVCVLAVISGCKKTTDSVAPVNVTVAPAAAPAPAPVVTLALTTPAKLGKDLDATPRIAAPATPALVKVNATLDAIDKDAKDQRHENKTFTRSGDSHDGRSGIPEPYAG